MTDVRMQQTEDGGEIAIVRGDVELDDGFETAVYLSLFGGNRDDPGLPGERSKEWWGNKGETDESRKLRSRTQHLLATLPPNASSLRRIEDAARQDLAWVSESYSGTVETSARIPALGKIALTIVITIDGQRSQFTYQRNWAKK